MNKLIAVFALLACVTGCAESTAEGRVLMADMDHGPAVSGDGPAARAPREMVPREHVVGSRAARGDLFLCAKCR